MMLFVFSLSNNVLADTNTSNNISVDGNFILQKALQKQYNNFRGDMISGDNANEVYGYKTGYLDMNNKITLKINNLSTTTESKINIRIDSKMDKKTKNLITNNSIKTTEIKNGIESDPDLMKIIEKYTKGNLIERYFDTTIGEEKVYNVWKRNIVKDYFDNLFTNIGVSTSTKKSILQKIVAKKNIKFTYNDIKKGVNSGMGLTNNASTTGIIIDKNIATKDFTTIDIGFPKFLRVKQYLGIINNEDYEIVDLKTNKKVTTDTPLHNMILTVDYVNLAEEAIKNNKVSEYSFGLLSNTGLTDQEIRQSFEYIYKNLEILIWIDGNNYSIKSFKVEPYEIYLIINNILNVTILTDINYIEDPTRKTGYIYPIPKSYITVKDIGNMLKKK